MQIVYKLANFRTGQKQVTESKQMADTLQKQGFKLMAAVWVNSVSYTKELTK